MGMHSYEAEFMKYPEYRLSKGLILYVPPVLLLMGTFGNVFSLIILTRKPMRKFSTYIYLAVLAVADTFVLYVGLMRLWLSEIMEYDLRDNHDWSCKLINMLGYTASDYSVWLIIAVTVERYIVTCHPFRAPTMCQTRRAALVVGTILSALILINLHFFWTVQVVYQKHDDQYISQCAGGDGYRHLIEDIWPWVDSCLYSFVPFVVILILNTMIVRQVLHAKRMRSELLPACPPAAATGGGPSSQPRRSSSQQDSNRLTVMLLTISFTFLLTTLPMNLSVIVMSFAVGSGRDLHYMTKMRLFQTITELLMYINHSCNFFLYCATGKKFRSQLVALLCRSEAQQQQQQVNTDTYVYAHSFSATNGIVVRIHEPDIPMIQLDSTPL